MRQSKGWAKSIARLGGAFFTAATMYCLGQSPQLTLVSVPATPTWQAGQQDLKFQVMLQNNGTSFRPIAGSLFVNVSGGSETNLPKVWDVRTVGMTGGWLTGSTISTSWEQQPLWNASPDVNNADPVLRSVAFSNSSDLLVIFLKNSPWLANVTIGTGPAKVLAEITVRRTGDLNAAGSWNLNLWTGTSQSFFDTPATLGLGRVNMPRFSVPLNALAISNLTNSPPSLGGATNATVNELAAYTQAMVPQDTDLPAQTLTVSLVSGPSGLVVTNGVVAWTPTEAQGPST
ncbi:MAG: hypothetical protein ACKOEQ_05735, partial [Verrucomicrobiota bacterium]